MKLALDLQGLTVPMFKLLFFRGNLLERFETIECTDTLSAIQEAAGRYSDDKVELWAESKRVAIFRPTRRHDHV